MSKISFLHRIPKNGVSGAIYVKHTHHGSPFSISTMVVLGKGEFDLASGVVNPGVTGAPELEATIRKVATYVQIAARNLQNAGVEPAAPAMRRAYDEVVRHNEARLPRLHDLVEGGRLRSLDILRLKQAEQEAELAVTKKEIEQLELILKLNQAPVRKLSYYCEQYAEAIKETAAANTTRLFRSLSRKVAEYDEGWQIDQVTPTSLQRFEKWLIQKGKRNLTITDALTKIKTVVYYHARQLGLSQEFIRDLREHKASVKKKRNPNVVFLAKEELEELIELPLSNEVEQRVRDRFVLMCLLGVRYSDSVIGAEDIRAGKLLLTTVKTDTDLEIPLGKRADGILKQYGYNIPAYPEQHFNKIIKLICSRLPCLQHKIQIKDYRGKNKAERTMVKKYEKISGHVARRTFITLALLRGVNPVAIAAIVGHSGTDLIMKVYGSKEAGMERMMDLLAEE